jgi:triacylglycerol lipase
VLSHTIAFFHSVWAVALEAWEVLLRPTVLLLLAGVILGISSFVRLVSPDPQRLRWGVAIVLFAVALLLGQVGQPPDHVNPDAIPVDRKPAPTPRTSLVDRLRRPWDSEDRGARWPVCETLAVLSDIAYQTPVAAEEEIIRLGFTGIMPLMHNSMVGYVVWHEDASVVVFRGTNEGEAADWAVNLRDTTFETSNGGIHRGFWVAYQSLKPQLVATLAKRRPKHLWITGHSLGGALALVCAIDIATDSALAFDGLITFGQPKVARSDLASYVDTALVGKYARVVIRDDIVAQIPLGKAYCGSLVWFTSEGLKRSPPLRSHFGASARNGDVGDWVELPSLSPEQLSEWKTQHRRPERLWDPLPDEPLSYQGNSPFIKDHEMTGYIYQVRQHLGTDP